MKELDLFLTQQIDFLLCTDLASRGLDIPGVKTVINYDAPDAYEVYLHRVGRTARAGRSGRAVTLASESDRKLLKMARKQAKQEPSRIVSRLLPTDKLDEIEQRITSLKEAVEDILEEEKAEKTMKIAERDLKKGENVIKHHDEIMARPKRTWFTTERQKALAKRKDTDSHGSAKRRK
jgi:ATP-dependent RNA helicase DDX27